MFPSKLRLMEMCPRILFVGALSQICKYFKNISSVKIDWIRVVWAKFFNVKIIKGKSFKFQNTNTVLCLQLHFIISTEHKTRHSQNSLIVCLNVIWIMFASELIGNVMDIFIRLRNNENTERLWDRALKMNFGIHKDWSRFELTTSSV